MTPEEEQQLLAGYGTSADQVELNKGWERDPAGMLGDWTQETVPDANAGQSLQALHPELAPQPQPTITQVPQTPKLQPSSVAGGNATYSDANNNPDHDRMMQMRQALIDQSQASGTRGWDGTRAAIAFAGGDVGAYDRRRQYDAEASDRATERQLKNLDLQDRMDERKTRTQLARDSVDANSELSRNAATDFDSALDSYAKILGPRDPGYAQDLKRQIGSTKGRSKADIDRALGRMEKSVALKMQLYGLDFNQAKALADAKAKQDAQKETNDIRREGIAASKANAEASRSIARENMQNRREGNDAKNQDKLDEKIEGFNNAEDLLGQAIEDKKNVNVGFIATPFNKARQYTPWPNKDFDNLQQHLGSVRNEIKLMKSGKAVTPTEENGLNEELANLEKLQDDPTFDSRLAGMMKRIKKYKERATNQLQRRENGTTRDRSNTARTATGEGAVGGAVDTGKAERARAALADPAASPKAKAGAQAYLDSLR